MTMLETCYEQSNTTINAVSFDYLKARAIAHFLVLVAVTTGWLGSPIQSCTMDWYLKAVSEEQLRTKGQIHTSTAGICLVD